LDHQLTKAPMVVAAVVMVAAVMMVAAAVAAADCPRSSPPHGTSQPRHSKSCLDSN
jgi:hypothetical protein